MTRGLNRGIEKEELDVVGEREAGWAKSHVQEITSKSAELCLKGGCTIRPWIQVTTIFTVMSQLPCTTEEVLCLTEESGLLMSSLCKEINALLREAGAGGWGNTRGAKAVDFKQGTWEDGEFATMNKGLPFPRKLFSLASRKYAPAWFLLAGSE